MGRRRDELWHQRHVRFRQDEDEFLVELAEKQAESVANVIRRMVRTFKKARDGNSGGSRGNPQKDS